MKVEIKLLYSGLDKNENPHKVFKLEVDGVNKGIIKLTYDNWGRYQGYKFKIMDVTVNDHYYWEYEMDGIPTMDEVKKEIGLILGVEIKDPEPPLHPGSLKRFVPWSLK
jgi:hypothetical protein